MFVRVPQRFFRKFVLWAGWRLQLLTNFVKLMGNREGFALANQLRTQT